MRLRFSLLALVAFVMAPALAAQTAFINEFHYDNEGSDEGEFVEVAVPTGTAVSGLVVSLYNGNGGVVYDTYAGADFVAGGSAGGYTFYSIETPSIQNGPDGIALSRTDGTVLEFVSYEDQLKATDGPAQGMTSTDVGVVEDGSTPAGQSIQRTGDGGGGDDFAWTGPAEASRGQANTGQTFDDDDSDEAEVFTTRLLGANEVPPVTTGARGGVTLSLDGTTLTVTGVFAGLSGDYAAGHLHGGAAGANGPVVYGLTGTPTDDMRGGTFEAGDNTFEIRSTFADSLRAGLVYVNVHSSAFPSGEIRGQVGTTPDALTFTLSGDNEVPPVVTPATGSGTVTLDGTTMTVSGTFTGLTGTYAASHVHGGAAGMNGPVVQGLSPTVNSDNRGGAWGADTNTFEIRPSFADSVRAGLAYVNVHSSAFPSGEIRGQIGVAAGPNSTAVGDDVELGLSLAVVNPVRGQVTVRFAQAASGPVELALFDVLGRRVATLADGPAGTAERTATLDPSGLAAGVYVLRLGTEAGSLSRTVTVVR